MPITMTTLAEFMILSGGDNRPPMLEKPLYDSWKSIMELYMQNREHGRMILESVKHGPLIWPTIEENRATNIILQGLPSDVYSLVNHHRVAKDLWERVQLLMQGTSLTKQERECKLYDAFDKFAHIKGESLHQYYLRFTQLINDMNIYKMKLEQFQVNTKFLNSLPPEWSKFVTDVKLVRDLHTTNFDQLNAYLEQHELHANEVRIMRERNQDPLALVANHQMTPSHFNTYQSSYNNPQFQQQFSPSQSPQYGSIHPTQHYSTTYPSTPLAITYPSAPYPNAYSSIVHQDACPQPQSIPQIEYTVSIVNQQTHLAEFPQIDSGLAVPVFKQGDDPIDAINKMMSFLSTVVTSRFPSTNNQLRNSSNPRQQATIHDGREKKAKNIDKEISLEKKVKELDNIVYKMGQSIQTVHMLTKPQVFYDNNLKQALGFQNPFYLKKAQQNRPMLYDGIVIAKENNVISIDDSEETLMLEEES
ncbi:hypothetical protein Tco_0488787 [Tanacetum coccineum]